MKKYILLCLVILLSSHVTSFAQDISASTTSTSENSMLGYTKKFTLPDTGLTEEDKKLLSEAQRINDVLAETKDVNEIISQINNTIIMARFSSPIERKASYVEFASEQFENKNTTMRGIKVTVLNYGIFTFNFGREQNSHRTTIIIERHNIPERLSMFFHKNGNLAELSYYTGVATKVKREASWSEDGKLIREREITKPEPLNINIRKGDQIIGTI